MFILHIIYYTPTIESESWMQLTLSKAGFACPTPVLTKDKQLSVLRSISDGSLRLQTILIPCVNIYIYMSILNL